MTREMRRASTRAAGQTAFALGAWVALVVTGRVGGKVLNARGLNLVLPAPPLLGRPGLDVTAAFLVPIAAAALLIAALPVAARRLSWRSLLVATVGAAALWAVALALAEGVHGLTRGVADRTDYLHDVPWVRAHAGHFLAHFSSEISHFEIQVRGHPPGMVLLLAAMAAIGLGGAGWEAALVIGAGATASAAVLLAVKEVAGEPMARRAMPWLVLSPAAIFVASSADALYMALAAWSGALVILATGRAKPRATTLAAIGGIVFGLALLGSYGMVLAALPPVAVAFRRGRRQCLLVAGVGAGAVLATLLPFGFFWLDGLRATLHEYQRLPIDRPYAYFLVGNLAAWALALGPAIAAAVVRLRDRRLQILVGAAGLAAALADVSGLSRGEVERIWLPFTIWVLAAGATLSTDDRSTRAWLAVQAFAALGIVATVTTQW